MIRVPDKSLAIASFVFLLIVCLALILLKIEFDRDERKIFYGRDKRKFDESTIDDDDDDGAADNDDAVGGFGNRRIPKFSRRGIVLPDDDEIVGNTRFCDDFRETPKECFVNDGYNACFDCVESRTSLRVCAHFDRDVTVFDTTTRKNIIIKANTTETMGYCVRDNIAAELGDLAEESGRLREARELCRIANADWLLTRLNTSSVKRRNDDNDIGGSDSGGGNEYTIDTNYTFACVCRYPHLLTNEYGPQSACTRDVGCGNHGRLDELSLAGEIDPFIDGRCICDDGYISERSEIVGPYCREATFEEWPSVYYGVKKSPFDLELNSREISAKFADRINARRIDDARAKVWLPDPCRPHGCDLAYLPPPLDAYFCRDYVTFEDDFSPESNDRRIRSLSIAFYSDRDYLRNNEGVYPNRCLFVPLEALDRETVVLQYMSQPWNDGRHFAQEMGFLLKRSKLDLVMSNYFQNATIENVRESLERAFASDSYRRFVATLKPAINTGLQRYGILWTHNADYMLDSRKYVSLRFADRLTTDRTNLGMYRADGHFWLEFPYYVQRGAFLTWYYTLDKYASKQLYEKYRFLKILNCGEARPLVYLLSKSENEISERRAYELLARLPPTFLVLDTDGKRTFRRHDINPAHDNKTGCVIFSFVPKERSYCGYCFAVSYPRGRDMRKFSTDRSLCANN